MTIADLLAAARMLRSLNPEVVVPGHGSPGTTKIFDESEKYYTLLLERVTAMVKAGKTREQIGMELKMPDTRTGRTRNGCRATSTPPIARPRVDYRGVLVFKAF